jgi:polar amino acid transport system substrate-binding protein
MTRQMDERSRIGRIPPAVLVSLLAILALSVASAEAQTAPPKRLAGKGILTYCTDISFPPLEYYDTKTQQPIGFDIDLAKALAAEIGLKAEFKNIGFDGIIPAMQAGQCDAIISGLNDNPARRQVVDFVDYSFLGNSLIARSDSTFYFKTLEEASGRTVATETGTTLEEDLKKANDNLKAAGKPLLKVTALPKASEAFQQLTAGLVELYYSTTVQEVYFNTENPREVKLVSPQISGFKTGVATVKADADLHQALDAALKTLQANGDYDKIAKKWNCESIALNP